MCIKYYIWISLKAVKKIFAFAESIHVLPSNLEMCTNLKQLVICLLLRTACVFVLCCMCVNYTYKIQKALPLYQDLDKRKNRCSKRKKINFCIRFCHMQLNNFFLLIFHIIYIIFSCLWTTLGFILHQSFSFSLI